MRIRLAHAVHGIKSISIAVFRCLSNTSTYFWDTIKYEELAYENIYIRRLIVSIKRLFSYDTGLPIVGYKSRAILFYGLDL